VVNIMARAGRLIEIAVAVTALVTVAPPAYADRTHAHGDDATDSVTVIAQQAINESQQTGTQQGTDADSPPTHFVPACTDRGGTPYNNGSACERILQCDHGNGYLVQEVTNTDPSETLNTFCVTEQELQQIAPTVTPGLVLTALRRIPLPAAELSIQPPGHRALVNFDVIFSTGARILTPTVTLLGQRVYLKIAPVTYRWVPGDGSEALVTDWEGQPFQRGDLDMGDYVSHRYELAGVVGPRVDVTYTAEFSVGRADRFQPVPGTVTVEGTPTALRIVEAAGVLNRGVSTRGSTGHQGSPEPGSGRRGRWFRTRNPSRTVKNVEEIAGKHGYRLLFHRPRGGVGACVSGGTDVA
jgi:hypothetical protein